MQDPASGLSRINLLSTRVHKGEGRMETSRTGASVGAWSSLLTIEDGRSLRVDGYDPFGTHYAHGEQVSARIFAALSVRPQRVTAPTVHAEHQPAHPGHFHDRLDARVVFEDLRAPARRRTKLGCHLRFHACSSRTLPRCEVPEHWTGGKSCTPGGKMTEVSKGLSRKD
jgi:hypothetical protein